MYVYRSDGQAGSNHANKHAVSRSVDRQVCGRHTSGRTYRQSCSKPDVQSYTDCMIACVCMFVCQTGINGDIHAYARTDTHACMRWGKKCSEYMNEHKKCRKEVQ